MEAAFFYCLNACPPACMHVKCGAGACACASALLQVLHVSVTESEAPNKSPQACLSACPCSGLLEARLTWRRVQGPPC